MTYFLIDENEVIVNTIECDDPVLATKLGAVEINEELDIGDMYTPPMTTEEKIAALREENTALSSEVDSLKKENDLLDQQISAQSEQMDFYEECIVEMAAIVYA